MRTRLDKELITPAVERLEGLCAVDVVNEDTAIRTTVEGDTERLEALLAGGVPELISRSERAPRASDKKEEMGDKAETDLHGD